MSLRYGFKSEANDIAREIRSELGLAPIEPLYPWLLAQWLDIPIIELSEFTTAAPAVAYLLEVEHAVFSAVTVFCGTRRTIVHNDGHLPGRQHSNIAHEVSHGLLHHPGVPELESGHRGRSTIARGGATHHRGCGAEHRTGPSVAGRSCCALWRK
jgi:IrrE N-terminal-like domain